MNLQYYHNRALNELKDWIKEYTVVFDVPTKGNIYHFINCHLNPTAEFPKLLAFNYGIAKLHPKDNYVKTVGRNVAKNKMKFTMFTIKEITFNKDGFQLILTDPYINITLDVNHNREKVYFINAELK